MFKRSADMYEHVNAMVRLSLQLRKELESNRTDGDRAQCVMGCKAIRQHTDKLGALIDATFDEQAFLDETFPDPGSMPPGIAATKPGANPGARPAAPGGDAIGNTSQDTSPLATIGGGS